MTGLVEIKKEGPELEFFRQKQTNKKLMLFKNLKERPFLLKVTVNMVLKQDNVGLLQNDGFTVDNDSKPLEVNLSSKKNRDELVQYSSWGFKGDTLCLEFGQKHNQNSWNLKAESKAELNLFYSFFP